MKYRRLEKDEVIQEGDEVDACRDPWRDEPRWVKSQAIGERVPDPRFPAHSIYRRPIASTAMEPLVVRCWDGTDPLPLTVRENEFGDGVDFTTEPKQANAEILLHADDARKVGEWLIRFADSRKTDSYDDLRARLASNGVSADCGYEILTSKNPADDLAESPNGTTVARELAT